MKNKYVWLACCLLTLALLCGLLIPTVAIHRSTSYTALASLQTKQISTALITYSFSGKKIRAFPDHLYQLEELLDLDYEVTKYSDPESGVYYDWLYYGRGVTPSKHDVLESEFILIAVPTLFNNHGLYPEEGEAAMRVVVYMNGKIEAIPETEFIERITIQTANTAARSKTSPR